MKKEQSPDQQGGDDTPPIPPSWTCPDEHNLQPVVIATSQMDHGLEVLHVVMVCAKCGYSRKLEDLIQTSELQDLTNSLDQKSENDLEQKD